jgi:hypothetical protein
MRSRNTNEGRKKEEQKDERRPVKRHIEAKRKR